MTTVSPRPSRFTTAARVRESQPESSRTSTVAGRFGAVLGLLTAAQLGTQFRAPGSLGPIEIALGLLVICALLWGRRNSVQWGPVLVLALLFSVSTLLALFVQSLQPSSEFSLSDLLSLTLISLSLLAIGASGSPFIALRSWALTFGVTVVLGSLLLYVFRGEVESLLGIKTFYGGIRFRGVSKNPNQAALALTIALCCLASLTQRRRLWWMLPLIASAIALILATGSDSARLGLMAGAATYALLFCARRLPAVWRLLLAAASALLLLSLNEVVRALWARYISSPLDVQNQLLVRETIWRTCWSQVVSAPVLGSGVDVVPSDTGGFECHNFFLDVGIVGGLPILLGLLAILVFLSYRLWVCSELVVLSALMASAVCQFGNSAMRFPFTWLWLSYVYWLTRDSVKPLSATPIDVSSAGPPSAGQTSSGNSAPSTDSASGRVNN